MLKSSIAVLGGIIGGSAVIWLIEAFGHILYPVHPGMDTSDPESVGLRMHEMPLAGLLLILLAYAAGSAAGGWIAAAISEKIRDAIIVGFILLAFCVFDLVMVSHPVWFTVSSILLFIPMAYLGGITRLGRRRPDG